MSGSGMFHVFRVGTAATGVVWLHYLTTMYPQQHFVTTRGRRYRVTHTLLASETDGRFSSTVNVDADSGDGYCIRDVRERLQVAYRQGTVAGLVDIFLCHYMEPVTDSMQTLKN
ncbi:unnamed protein product [Hyaloperonospora brassicae]|uniref:PRELI/MSF1 domain-containing protein n=1 Tax=Hyaloperonospora brassicae TaxID=162125 RepID=A0AAV0U3Q6_HYABA|nr:unnamed protein product [Hyaloperonospora brassicae]